MASHSADGEAMDAVRTHPVRVLELFAGVGGMRLALSYAGLNIETVAVEVNESALRVYAHNFSGDGSIITKDICSLPAAWFEQQRCCVWTMSPPCQPYTRQGNLRDTKDPRARPLLHIIEVLREMEEVPRAIVLENVRNFERSESCALLLAALGARGYAWRSFLLSPMQFGFPNARKRFYLVAKQDRFPFTLVPSLSPWQRLKLCEVASATPSEDAAAERCIPWPCTPCREALRTLEASVTSVDDRLVEVWDSLDCLAGFVDDKHELCAACGRNAPIAATAKVLCDQGVHQNCSNPCNYVMVPLAEFLDPPPACANYCVDALQQAARTQAPWMVPESIMRKEAARCLDIVSDECCHSMCFTKAYGRYMNGTGSVLLLQQRHEQPGLKHGEYAMRDYFGRVRYFTPREVARLLGFKLRAHNTPCCADGCLPRCTSHSSVAANMKWTCTCAGFDFPESLAVREGSREAWALLGNSLNPQVVGLVCRLCQIEQVAEHFVDAAAVDEP